MTNDHSRKNAATASDRESGEGADANTPRPVSADREFAPILGRMAQIRQEDDVENQCFGCAIRDRIPGWITSPQPPGVIRAASCGVLSRC